ncbi:MAG: fumarylacetoacetate hydrolase family protein [Bacteroidota bacterium]
MKIIGIGKNYHQPNQPRDDQRQDPIIFTKPTSSIAGGSVFNYPDCSNDVHYELEIVLKINQLIKNRPAKACVNVFDEIALGLDWTAKDLQQTAKSKGLPWFFAKGFDEATFLSEWIDATYFSDLKNLNLTFLVNGEKRISGNTKEMILSYGQIISHVSRFMTLEPGDLIMTGTPHTPGPIHRGDQCEGLINGERFLHFNVI